MTAVYWFDEQSALLVVRSNVGSLLALAFNRRHCALVDPKSRVKGRM